MGERFTFFWAGPFSQWFPSVFTINGVAYNCAEQYMMAEKARLCRDTETCALIMESPSPRLQKSLGRRVRPFDADLWEGIGRDVVYTGNYAKFTQNPPLLESLLATAGTTLVEANPQDRIWGIGLSEDDPRASARETWLGTNWLGETLTSLRDDLASRA